LAEWVKDEFGKGSFNKFIPKNIRMATGNELKLFLSEIVKGDGNIRANATQKKDTAGEYRSYFSVSKRLADGVSEIAWKCGYAPKISLSKYTGKFEGEHIKYCVYFSDSKFGKFPAIEFKSKKYNGIERVPYEGLVYCFEVPNRLFVTRRNGLIAIQGNTFANASVGVQVLLNRYMRFQKMLSNWITNVIYKPVARAQGFWRTKDDGERELIVPHVEWEMMRLKDDAQQKTVLQALQTKGLISKQTLLVYFGIDYEKEQEMIRQEAEDAAELKKNLATEPPKAETKPAPTGRGDLKLVEPGPGGGGGAMPEIVLPGGGPGAGPAAGPGAVPAPAAEEAI
jgi:hypothetical protein